MLLFLFCSRLPICRFCLSLFPSLLLCLYPYATRVGVPLMRGALDGSRVYHRLLPLSLSLFTFAPFASFSNLCFCRSFILRFLFLRSVLDWTRPTRPGYQGRGAPSSTSRTMGQRGAQIGDEWLRHRWARIRVLTDRSRVRAERWRRHSRPICASRWPVVRDVEKPTSWALLPGRCWRDGIFTETGGKSGRVLLDTKMRVGR